jgi:hypothetical protein
MALMVYSNEITASFTGFPLTVSTEEEFDTVRLTIAAGERDDGAMPQWVNIEATKDDMRRILTEALEALDGDDTR